MRRRWKWLAGIAVVSFVSVGVFVRLFIDEPLRRTIEHNVNKRLVGYTARIRTLHFHPLGFSLDLIDSTIFQDAHPDPPVAHLSRLTAGVHWRALLHGRLVADFLIDRPTLRINLKQAKKEVEDEISIDERGWQDALEEIYPLKANELRVRDADITYVDEGPFKPLHLSRVNFRAGNIRNVRSRERVYPSDIHLEGIVFDSGKAVLNGHADFLAKPHPGIKANFSLKHVELDYFKPIIRRYYVSVRNGIVSSDGRFEYAPNTKIVDIQHATIQGAHIDYVHRPQTEAAEKQFAEKVVRTAKKLSNHPEIVLRIDKVNILKSTFGFVNKAAGPGYQVFLADADINLDNVSNQGAEGAAVGTLRGKFMGSGKTVVNVTLRPKARSADFDLRVRIDETKMATMNDLLLAYGNFDAVDGLFSFYSEFSVRNGEIKGYVKPLFKGMKIYDARQDSDKAFFRKVREALIGGIAWILQNRARGEVATSAQISGRIDDPEISTWEIVMGLIQNAFFKAVLPGFEREVYR